MEQTEKKSNKKFLATIAIILVVAILAGLVGGLAYRKARGDISVVQANASHQSLNAGFTDVKIKDKTSALKAVDSVKEKLGLTSAEKELEVVGTQKSGGNKYYRMQQYHDGMPVYGRQMVVGADEDGNSLSLTTNYEPIGGELSTDPSVDDATVRKNIEKQLKKESKKTAVTTKKTTTTEASTTETTKEETTKKETSTKKSEKTTEEETKEETTEAKTEETTESTTESTTEETTSASSGNVFIDALTETNLCIYNFLKDSTAVLAYALNVQNETGNWKAIVDANSGEVLDLLSMTFTSSAGVKDASGNAFTASYNRSQDMYVLEDESLKTYIATFGGGNSHDGASCIILESEDNVFGNTSKEQNLNYEKGATYYRTLTDIQKRFKSLYGAKADNILVALYDDSADYGDNGYATVDTMQGTPYIPDGTQIGVISLGMNKDVTAIDLIAHEYMHRVEQNKVGLYYRSESGAIMEAYSDVFGELLEADVNGSADWVHNGIRSLKNPADTENPEEYGGARWKSTSDDYDHGNVHNNSTVLSHAAYLMTTGVDGTNALSEKQLGVLWFEALNRFTPDETFEQAAAALYATAQDQARLGRLSTDQVDTVASALATVGLPVTADTEVTTTKAAGGVFNKKQELTVPKTAEAWIGPEHHKWTYKYDLDKGLLTVEDEYLDPTGDWGDGYGLDYADYMDGLITAESLKSHRDLMILFNSNEGFNNEMLLAYNPLISSGKITQIRVLGIGTVESDGEVSKNDKDVTYSLTANNGKLIKMSAHEIVGGNDPEWAMDSYTNVEYEYDEAGRIAKITSETHNNLDETPWGPTYYFDYSVKGITIKQMWDSGYRSWVATMNDGVILESQFDEEWQMGDSQKGNIIFEYDKTNNLTAIYDKLAGSTLYRYGEKNWLEYDNQGILKRFGETASGMPNESPFIFTYQTIKY